MLYFVLFYLFYIFQPSFVHSISFSNEFIAHLISVSSVWGNILLFYLVACGCSVFKLPVLFFIFYSHLIVVHCPAMVA